MNNQIVNAHMLANQKVISSHMVSKNQVLDMIAGYLPELINEEYKDILN